RRTDLLAEHAYCRPQRVPLGFVEAQHRARNSEVGGRVAQRSLIDRALGGVQQPARRQDLLEGDVAEASADDDTDAPEAEVGQEVGEGIGRGGLRGLEPGRDHLLPVLRQRLLRGVVREHRPAGWVQLQTPSVSHLRAARRSNWWRPTPSASSGPRTSAAVGGSGCGSTGRSTGTRSRPSVRTPTGRSPRSDSLPRSTRRADDPGSRYWNRTEMLSRRAMRRMASPNRPATETTSTLEERASGWVSTLSVMKRRSIGLRSSRSLAWPARRPWLTAAHTDAAPRSTRMRAASMIVPAEIVKSSTMSALRPSTDPISSRISADSVWSARRLSAIAVGACRRFAQARAFLA